MSMSPWRGSESWRGDRNSSKPWWRRPRSANKEDCSWEAIQALKKQLADMEKRTEAVLAKPVKSGVDAGKPDQDALQKRLANLRKLKQSATDPEDVADLAKKITTLEAKLVGGQPVHDRLRLAQSKMDQAEERMQRNREHLRKAQESYAMAQSNLQDARQELEKVRREVAHEAPGEVASNGDAVRQALQCFSTLLSQAATTGGTIQLDAQDLQTSLAALSAAAVPSQPISVTETESEEENDSMLEEAFHSMMPEEEMPATPPPVTPKASGGPLGGTKMAAFGITRKSKERVGPYG